MYTLLKIGRVFVYCRNPAYLQAAGRSVFSAMEKADPDAVWLVTNIISHYDCGVMLYSEKVSCCTLRILCFRHTVSLNTFS